MAADVGTIQRFPKIIGSASLARELIFTGRKFTAHEAKEWGLVNTIYDTKEKYDRIISCLMFYPLLFSEIKRSENVLFFTVYLKIVSFWRKILRRKVQLLCKRQKKV